MLLSVRVKLLHNRVLVFRLKVFPFALIMDGDKATAKEPFSNLVEVDNISDVNVHLEDRKDAADEGKKFRFSPSLPLSLLSLSLCVCILTRRSASYLSHHRLCRRGTLARAVWRWQRSRRLRDRARRVRCHHRVRQRKRVHVAGTFRVSSPVV